MDNYNSLKSSYGFTLVEKAYRPNMEDTEAIVASIIALYKNAFALNHIPQFTLINDSTSEDIHTVVHMSIGANLLINFAMSFAITLSLMRLFIL